MKPYKTDEKEKQAMKIRVLSRDNLAEALDLSSVIEGVEAVYQAKAQGKAVAWPLVEYKF